jgi:hypothetical protein
VAYVLMLDQLERLALAFLQAAAIARALGGTAELPNWFEFRDDFDATLAAEPKRVDTKQLAVLQAIGLRR